MANPQPIPFVKLSKELFDAIMLSPMAGTQLGVVLAVVRRTYGNGGLKQAAISVGLLAKILGQNKGTVSRALSDLVSEGVIRVVREEHHRTTRILALNKDYETWGRYSVSESECRATVAEEQPSDESNGCSTATQRLPGSNPTVAEEQPNGCLGATIKDSREEQTVEKTSIPKRPVVSAPTEVDWQARADELLAASHFPSDLYQLGQLLAARNKSGKAQLSRIVRELYEPIVALQDEFPDQAIRYGLRAAITKPAPNANYVKAAARGYQGGGEPAANSYQQPLDDYDRGFFTDTYRDEVPHD